MGARAAGRERLLFPEAAHTHKVCGDEEGDGGDPRGGVGGADARKSPQPDKEEGGNDAPRKLRHARKGGDGALADALQRVAVDVNCAQKEIERPLP